MRLWIPITLIAGGLVLLLGTNIYLLGIPELPVREFSSEFDGREIKIQGVLKKIHEGARPLKFDICDREDASLVMQVEVDDVRPDVFDEGKDIAVIGVFDPTRKIMVGTKIFTKCPSKYEASEELNSSASPVEPPTQLPKS